MGWPLEFVAVFVLESVLVDGVDVEVVAFEFVVLLIVVDFVGDELLVVVAALVDRVLGEFGLDNFHSAQMPAAGQYWQRYSLWCLTLTSSSLEEVLLKSS